jgi:hypothetical protein
MAVNVHSGNNNEKDYSISGKIRVSHSIALLLDNEYAIPNLPSEMPSSRYVSLR